MGGLGKVKVETVSTQEICLTWANVRKAMATRLISPCHVASSSGGDGHAKLTFGPLDDEGHLSCPIHSILKTPFPNSAAHLA